MVIKTSVYLDDEDKRRLGELARATGTSEADLIRRGVGLVLTQAERPRPRLGLGASTDGDERHFRAVQPLQGGSFRLLPADS